MGPDRGRDYFKWDGSRLPSMSRTMEILIRCVTRQKRELLYFFVATILKYKTIHNFYSQTMIKVHVV